MLSNVKKSIVLVIVLSFLIIPLPSQANADEEKISFMYLYGGTTADYIQQFQLARGAINVVSPNFFELDTNGNLIVTVDQTLTNFMHQQNVQVVPYLSNHWNRENAQKALQKPEKLATDIANAVITYNLDGINIDLENLTYADRLQLTHFASILKNKLAPHNKTVSIAVGSIDKPTYSGWKSAYDLSSLGKILDYVIIMAYDQHWRTSGPGPIASLPWVTQQLDYMLTQLPKEKTVLGVPFYGRIWTNGQNGGGIWHSDVIKAVQEEGATIKWHDEYQVPFVKYTKADGREREIWFENRYSLEKKVKLVNTYNLKGVAAWRLGQEDPTIWKDFSTWLTGSSFQDTKNHWAKNDIEYLSSRGYVSGRDRYNYVPDAGINRAEAVAVLSRIFDWQPGNSNPFIDVPANYWAKEPILKAYQNSIVRGISPDKFGPEQKLTRAQLAVILQRAFNLQINDEIRYEFTDVPENYWASTEIYILKNRGFIAGRSETHYAPDNYVTRAEFAAMVSRIIK